MKIIRGIISAALLITAFGSVSAATIDQVEVKMEKMPRTAMISREAVFSQVVSRHTDRVIEMHLDRQSDLAVAGMYEAPIAVAGLEIEIEL